MSHHRTSRGALGDVEFTLLLSMMMALAALGIDIILPGLGAVRDTYGLAEDSTAVAAVVTVYILGLALPQLVYGPLADRYGRKPLVTAGFVIYMIGAIASALAPSLGALLVARFIWGVGAAGPRGLAVTIVRDRYSGDRMARALSYIFAVFIIVPIIAPALGAGLVAIADWRLVFVFCAVWAGAIGLWALRLPETLNPADRLELTFARIWAAAREVATNRQTVGYTLALTFLSGVFLSYIASSELILDDVFDLAGAFPYVFGAFAVVMGIAMLANGSIVGRFGARRLGHTVLAVYLGISLTFTAMSLATSGTPPFWAFAVVLAPFLACHALMLPNFNSIAMLPMGHIAGTASALISAFSLAGGALLGAVIDQAYDGTVLPFAMGALLYGLAAGGCVAWATRGRTVEHLGAVAPEPAEG